MKYKNTNMGKRSRHVYGEGVSTCMVEVVSNTAVGMAPSDSRSCCKQLSKVVVGTGCKFASNEKGCGGDIKV